MTLPVILYKCVNCVNQVKTKWNRPQAPYCPMCGEKMQPTKIQKDRRK